MSKLNAVVLLTVGFVMAIVVFFINGPAWVLGTAFIAGVYTCGFASSILLFSLSPRSTDEQQDAQVSTRSQYQTGNSVKVAVDEGSSEETIHAAIIEKANWMKGSAKQSKGKYFICVNEFAHPVELVWRSVAPGYVAPTEKKPGVFSY